MGTETAIEEKERYWALRELPPFPAIATKLLSLLSREDIEIADVVRLIRADAAFSSELLRVANSPVYGLRSQVSSVQHAVAILGFDTVRAFAMTISMKNFLRPAMRIDVLRRVWRHSLASALICEELAPKFWPGGDRHYRDRAYTAGLLHDLGRLGLLVKYPQEYANLLAVVAENPFGILEAERALFDIDHCEAGGWLARTWTFPAEIGEVAQHHHEPPSRTQGDLLNLVRSGVLITDWLGFDVTYVRLAHEPDQVLALLPESLQPWIGPDASERKAALQARLDSFD